jgi:hypothetical protein
VQGEFSGPVASQVPMHKIFSLRLGSFPKKPSWFRPGNSIPSYWFDQDLPLTPQFSKKKSRIWNNSWVPTKVHRFEKGSRIQNSLCVQKKVRQKSKEKFVGFRKSSGISKSARTRKKFTSSKKVHAFEKCS